MTSIVKSIFGGGSGGGESKTTTQEIPAWMRKYIEQNLQTARKAQQVGYMPYTGLDVAAFNPTQLAAQQMNIDAAKAFGMLPAGYGNLKAAQGMPKATTIGGVQGYSSYPMYSRAVHGIPASQRRKYNKVFS